MLRLLFDAPFPPTFLAGRDHGSEDFAAPAAATAPPVSAGAGDGGAGAGSCFCCSGSFAQFNGRARMRADEFLPVSLGPETNKRD
ncbi:hypothetical protein [Corynebacterium sp. HMSC29G08]|uniref:hypothetical protein n=1 Tax=Corynebacterium sp. HMSC29G08 TaxID=1581069 RepID=UPI00143A6404|nr:hypothetical protein [Corynebacterium sp. HMSC29G08]